MHSRIATCAIVALTLTLTSSVEAFVHQPAPLADASAARRTSGVSGVTHLQILRMSADGADADGVMNKYSR